MLRPEALLGGLAAREPAPERSPPGPSFGISAGAWFLPPQRRRLEDWAAAVGPAALELVPSMRANGLAHYHVAPHMSVESLCAAAVQRLLDDAGRAASEVDLVVYCHTNTTSVMAPPSSIPATLVKRFGMTRATGYSVSQQNCASIVCALRLLRTLMWRHAGLNEVLIVSADKVFGEASRNVSNYAIQSDGALALWVSRGAALNRIGHIAYNIDGRYFRGSAKGAELTRRYGLNYAVSAHHVIAEVIRRSGWSAAQVDAVLPMNANLTAFSKVIELLGMPSGKLHARNIGVTGHLFCCDPFVNFLERFKDPKQVESGNAILFASASSGVFSAIGIDRAWTGAPAEAPLPCTLPGEGAAVIRH
jgi:3-oxoacyl-[acyl-carrier-protein] synthase-3